MVANRSDMWLRHVYVSRNVKCPLPSSDIYVVVDGVSDYELKDILAYTQQLTLSKEVFFNKISEIKMSNITADQAWEAIVNSGGLKMHYVLKDSTLLGFYEKYEITTSVKAGNGLLSFGIERIFGIYRLSWISNLVI